MKDLAKIVVSSDASFSLEEGFERAGSPEDAVAKLASKVS